MEDIRIQKNNDFRFKDLSLDKTYECKKCGKTSPYKEDLCKPSEQK